MQLYDRIRVNNWDEVAFIIIMILVTVAIIDFFSKRLREKSSPTRLSAITPCF
jgi:phosphonate transport system permease protein